MPLTAAVDGSALGNPGPAGWAWYVDDDRWAAGGWPTATNNQGELQAVLELLRAARGRTDALHILCDSQYVINSVTKWMPGWKAKGWKKRDGKPVLNREQLQAIDDELTQAGEDGVAVTFEWVKGHADHEMNEAADTRARGAAEAFRKSAPVPHGPGIGGGSDASLPSGAPGGAAAAEEPVRTEDPQSTEEPLPAGESRAAERTRKPGRTTVTCTLDSDEAAAIVAAAERAGRHPQDELAALIRLGMTHSYGK